MRGRLVGFGYNSHVRVLRWRLPTLRRATLENNISSDMMCAVAGNQYICHGDGGGPAIRRGDTPEEDGPAIRKGNTSEEDQVPGIVSWGYFLMGVRMCQSRLPCRNNTYRGSWTMDSHYCL